MERRIPLLRTVENDVLVDYVGRDEELACDLKSGELLVTSQLTKPVDGMVVRFRQIGPKTARGVEPPILKAQLTSVQGVLPGQGQAVQISGVRVGQIGPVELVDGAAIAKLRIETKYAHIYPDATVLLRPKTPLKDMVAELDPGSPKSGPELRSGALLRTSHTAVDVNLEEVLATRGQPVADPLDPGVVPPPSRPPAEPAVEETTPRTAAQPPTQTTGLPPPGAHVPKEVPKRRSIIDRIRRT